MNCTQYQLDLPELAFDPQNAPAALKAHVDQCPACFEALRTLQATLTLMDQWNAPELTPYFDVRMAARLREERAAAPAGFFEQLRSRIQYLSNVQMQPLLAGVLATIIMIGGGAFAGLAPAPDAPSATVRDLRILDRNDKALDQMDQLLEADNDTGTSANSTMNP